MADQAVIEEVKTSLERSGIELETGAMQTLIGRIRTSKSFPVVTRGDVQEQIQDDAEVREVARESARLLAAALRERSPGPYSEDDLEAVLGSLCPIWPFC